MSTPLSIRLSDEVKEEFKILADQTGMKQEDFVATLLTSFKRERAETDTGSPVYRERAKVDEALSQIQRVVVGFLEIAHNDKEIKVLNAQEQVAQAQAEVAEMRALQKESRIQEEELYQYKQELEEKVDALEGQAKTLQVLQDAWTEKETALNARLADLDAEAKEARKLKAELAAAATEIMQQQNIVELAKQKASTDQETITGLKARLQKLDDTLEQSRTGHQTLKDTVNQQILKLTQSHAEEKGQLKDTVNQQIVTLTQSHAEEKGKLTAQIEFQAKTIADLETKLDALLNSRTPGE